METSLSQKGRLDSVELGDVFKVRGGYYKDKESCMTPRVSRVTVASLDPEALVEIYHHQARTT